MSQKRFAAARLLGRRILPASLAVITAYFAYPYVVLFQIGQAIRHGDAATLQRLVDWDGVREGLKEDVCDELSDAPPAPAEEVKAGAVKAADTLPPFGFSFVRGVAGNMIDTNVTAAGLVSAAREAGLGKLPSQAEDLWPDSAPRIAWAFFESPTSFLVRLQPADPAIGPIRILLEMHGTQWKVVRAWLPRDLLARANARI